MCQYKSVSSKSFIWELNPFHFEIYHFMRLSSFEAMFFFGPIFSSPKYFTMILYFMFLFLLFNHFYVKSYHFFNPHPILINLFLDLLLFVLIKTLFFYCFIHNLDGILYILMFFQLNQHILILFCKVNITVFILLKNLIILEKNIEISFLSFINKVFL